MIESSPYQTVGIHMKYRLISIHISQSVVTSLFSAFLSHTIIDNSKEKTGCQCINSTLFYIKLLYIQRVSIQKGLTDESSNLSNESLTRDIDLSICNVYPKYEPFLQQQ